MKKWQKYTIITVLSFVFVGLLVLWFSRNPTYNTTQLQLGGQVFTAEIADTPLLQSRGLSYRTSLGRDRAMLFVFPVLGDYQFWMKDMNFPLDIIWLDSEKKIIHIENNLSPATYPQGFGPQMPSQYVIEVSSGTAKEFGLFVGQQIYFSY